MLKQPWMVYAPDDPPPSGDPPPADPPDDGDEKVTMTKAEADALRAELATSRKAARKAQSDAAKAAEDKAKADGDFQKLAEEAQARATQAEEALAKRDRDELVKSVATRLKFRSPDRASRFLEDDDMTDEPSVERALKALKRDEPDLFSTSSRSGGEIEQDDKAGGRSMDDLIRQAAGRT